MKWIPTNPKVSGLPSEARSSSGENGWSTVILNREEFGESHGSNFLGWTGQVYIGILKHIRLGSRHHGDATERGCSTTSRIYFVKCSSFWYLLAIEHQELLEANRFLWCSHFFSSPNSLKKDWPKLFPPSRHLVEIFNSFEHKTMAAPSGFSRNQREHGELKSSTAQP